MRRKIRLSPNHFSTEFGEEISFDEILLIFEDRMLGWQLNIADQMVNGSATQPPIENSEFAMLSIIANYFEMIAKLEDGYTDPKHDRVGVYVKKGIRSVFKMTEDDERLEPFVRIIHNQVRNNLYHTGMTGKKVLMSSEFPSPLIFLEDYDGCGPVVLINHQMLISSIQSHFMAYMARLRDPRNTELRDNFHKRWQFMAERGYC